ncbi:DsbA family protein [Sphingobium lignivorans]|uniref:Protein-disulfide isomerase n=1 Tax=Sphingobium lignivorans TaxID=2735886 RepID=A0ABR6NIR7_9SPHN|nr:DsbA family protein [Sphingobium lignivorans]MBB5987178.1 protein-disulfide isomerase [Sphingobium lignivorans]
MKRLVALPAALALIALAGCGQQDSGANASAPGGNVAAKAAPAGSSWAQQVVATPEGGFRMGNPDAPIKLIEFGSYTCPHCADFTEQSHEPLERDYVNSGKVSFEYRNFVRDPLDIAVALLARCSGPEAFFPLNVQFFGYQEGMIRQLQSQGEGAYQAALTSPPEQRFIKVAELGGLIEFAKQRGIPEEKARQCLADVKTAEALASGVQRDSEKYQITGTPTLILNEKRLENAATWQALEEQLKGAGA